MKKKIGILLATVMSLGSLVPSNAYSTFSGMITDLEQNGNCIFNFRDEKSTSLKEAGLKILRLTQSSANKSSMTIDNKLRVTISSTGGTKTAKLDLPSAAYYDKLDLAIYEESGLTQEMTDAEKVFMAMTYTAKKLTYDANTTSLTQGFDSGRGDCKVYASLTARVLENNNIKTIPVYTTLNSNKREHVELEVNVDGRWYFIDPTEADKGESITLDKFLMSTKKAFSDRKLNTNITGKLTAPVILSTSNYLTDSYRNAFQLNDKRTYIMFNVSKKRVEVAFNGIANMKPLGIASIEGVLYGDCLYYTNSGYLNIVSLLTGRGVEVDRSNPSELLIKNNNVYADGRDVTLYKTYNKTFSIDLLTKEVE